MEYKNIRLSDFANINMGQSPKSEFYNYEGQGLPFLQGNRTFGSLFPTFDTYTTNPTKVAEPNDIIMSVRAPVGDLNIAPTKLCLGRGVCSLRAKNNNQKFLFYLMKYYVQQLINRESGTVFGSVNRDDIANLEVSIPEESVQRKIAAVLSSFDTKIELNTAINNNLERQFKELYKSYFCDKKSESWPIVLLPEFMFFQEGPGIRNWQYVQDNGTKFINIRCISDGDIDTSTANMISNEEANGKYKHFMLEENDIVMSCSGTLGRYAIVRKEHLPLCLNTSVIRFKAIEQPEDFAYIYGYLTSSEFLNKQIEMACGSVQCNFGPTHLKKISIKLPPKQLRLDFYKIGFPILNMILQNRKESAKLAAIRDALLPKLMSGEIDVSKVDISDPGCLDKSLFNKETE